MENQLHIKNMVCDRCILSVESIMQRHGIKLVKVKLGIVIFEGRLSSEKLKLIEESLHTNGFELIIDKTSQLVNSIKSEIVDLIHYSGVINNELTFAQIIAQKFNLNYSYLSKVFSKHQGQTISQFILRHKIEKAKELLSYGELNISEVSQELDFSSPQHFARQFKKASGQTPTQFISKLNRQKLDMI